MNGIRGLIDQGDLAVTDAQVHLWNRVAIPGREHRKIPLQADALLEAMASAGVERAILIPPSWGGDGNELVIDAVSTHPSSFRGIGLMSLDDSTLRTTFDTWHRENGLIGLRLLFNTSSSIAMLRERRLDWIWPLAEERNVPLMILAQECDDLLGMIASRHPRLRLTIDHLGVVGAPTGERFTERVNALLKLSDHPNVSVKATALPLYSEAAYPHADVLAHVRRIVDAYTPHRVFWGTDLSRLRCSYREAVDMMAEFDWRDAGETRLVMGNALVDWLGWEPVPVD